MPNVVVLLSTWNGMAFLGEQIDSVLNQEFGGAITIIVRDDGSRDGSVSYLRARDPRITVIQGENLGPRDSFLALIDHARGLQADVFALCDQDDVWHPQKLARAISHLHQAAPALYVSSVDLVDKDLNLIRTYQHPGDQSFASTLISNCATGCTCVFNRALLDRIPMPGRPARVLMHDWWLAVVAAAIGKVYYDRASFISYRQHASNHIGIASGLGGLARKIWKAMTVAQSVTRFDQARELEAALRTTLDDRQSHLLRAFLLSEHSSLRRMWFFLRHARGVGLLAGARFTFLG